MLPKLLRILFVALLITFFTHAQSFRLEGTIYDSSNKQPLSYATVQLKATTTGTTTNNQGRFTLDLPQGSHTLIVRYIGFRSQEVSIQIPYSNRLEVSLDPLSIELSEVVISSKDEDPAYRIIRKAIRNKENNIKSVNSFEYDEYRKDIFKSAGQIASIDESFLKTFKTGDKEKEFT
ncbi:MAG: carboxypeptidase-like regulatory domain-containing protein, partial [Methanococcaceae archaeon]